jgi:site-specific DNA-methyltransferase (adenine-specific)
MNELKNKIIQGDCLEVMRDIPDKSIDMVLADLPYNTTACHWDVLIPFEPLWEQYKRIIKDNGAIVLTASQPFTSALVMSNPKWFRHEWIWHKNSSGGFASAKYSPMKYHENILVFSKNKTKYNPQFQPYSESTQKRFKEGEKVNRSSQIKKSTNQVNGGLSFEGEQGILINRGKYPESVQKFYNEANNKRLHPTQKPVALFEYLIKTYTSVGDLVLDNCAGSGTTGVACKNLNRNYILIEKEPEYVEIINKRLS